MYRDAACGLPYFPEENQVVYCWLITRHLCCPPAIADDAESQVIWHAAKGVKEEHLLLVHRIKPFVRFASSKAVLEKFSGVIGTRFLTYLAGVAGGRTRSSKLPQQGQPIPVKSTRSLILEISIRVAEHAEISLSRNKYIPNRAPVGLVGNDSQKPATIHLSRQANHMASFPVCFHPRRRGVCSQ